MAGGLTVIALADAASAMVLVYGVFLCWRALGGVGWAAFSTVATTTMMDQGSRRGRAISLLLMSETLGLLLGTAGVGGCSGA
jgi:MFS family permease